MIMSIRLERFILSFIGVVRSSLAPEIVMVIGRWMGSRAALSRWVG